MAGDYIATAEFREQREEILGAPGRHSEGGLVRSAAARVSVRPGPVAEVVLDGEGAAPPRDLSVSNSANEADRLLIAGAIFQVTSPSPWAVPRVPTEHSLRA